MPTSAWSNRVRGVSPAQRGARMFIFTYIKIGVIVAICAVCGYLYWNYHHMAGVIEAQRIEIQNIKLKTFVLEEKQRTVDAFMKQRGKVQTRVIYETREIEKAVNTTDDTGLAEFYNKYRLHRKAPTGDTPAGARSRAKPATP